MVRLAWVPRGICRGQGRAWPGEAAHLSMLCSWPWGSMTGCLHRRQHGKWESTTPATCVLTQRTAHSSCATCAHNRPLQQNTHTRTKHTCSSPHNTLPQACSRLNALSHTGMHTRTCAHTPPHIFVCGYSCARTSSHPHMSSDMHGCLHPRTSPRCTHPSTHRKRSAGPHRGTYRLTPAMLRATSQRYG